MNVFINNKIDHMSLTYTVLFPVRTIRFIKILMRRLIASTFGSILEQLHSNRRPNRNQPLGRLGPQGPC